jgi:hypothetical protein
VNGYQPLQGCSAHRYARRGEHRGEHLNEMEAALRTRG